MEQVYNNNITHGWTLADLSIILLVMKIICAGQAYAKVILKACTWAGTQNYTVCQISLLHEYNSSLSNSIIARPA